MKILILNWRDIQHPRAGGAEVRLFETYSRLASKGHHIRLHCSGFDGGLDFEWIRGIEVIRHSGDHLFQIHALMKMRTWVRDYEPDIVIEDFNKLPFFSPWLHSEPKLIQVHHLWKKSIFREGNFFVSLVVYLMELSLHIVYRNQRFCSVSQSTSEELESFGIEAEQVTTIHNGFQWDWLQVHQDLLATQFEKPYFLWLSRLQKYKGIDDAIQAFERFVETNDDYDLYIAGSGPDSSRIKAKVRASSIAHRVHFLGFVDDVEKFQLLKGAKALLQTSYKEGWGLTVIEANSVGCPVIANTAPGLIDSVRDHESGLLYQYGSADDLAAKLRDLVNDHELYNRLSQGSLEWAKNFTWDQCAVDTEKLLREIIE